MYPDFSKARVMVVGDVMLDRYWHGDTSRISPEAPVPVVKIDHVEDRLGGAANVALNVSTLGAKTMLIGVLGCDEAGDQVQSLLNLNHIESHMIREKVKSITKLRVIGRSQQLIRCDFEETYDQFQAQILSIVEQHLSEVDVIILSDYAKGTLRNPAPFIALAQRHGVKVLVDPKSKDFSIYQGAYLLTPNWQEFEAAAGVCHTEEELHEKAHHLMDRMSFKSLLVTRGAKGMSLFQKAEEDAHIPTMAREVYDITGAGDTVIAVLAASLATGSPLTLATQLANLAAGLVVGKLGTAAVTSAELHDEWQALQLGKSHAVLHEDALYQKVLAAKARGEKIVMTNGCFDVIHAGHIDYLQKARRLGHRLIVAVNDDLSVKRLKGPLRPIYSLDQRMTLLGALSCVDWVTSFSEDTPLRLIEKIIPHTLVKGGDYQADDVVGAECVRAHGGSVEIIAFVPGCSTTGTLKKIEEAEAV